MRRVLHSLSFLIVGPLMAVGVVITAVLGLLAYIAFVLCGLVAFGALIGLAFCLVGVALGSPGALTGAGISAVAAVMALSVPLTLGSFVGQTGARAYINHQRRRQPPPLRVTVRRS